MEIILAFFCGSFLGVLVSTVIFVNGLEDYEKPTKWEADGIIKHKDRAFYLCEIK